MTTIAPSLIVHGGAWDIPDEHVEAHIAGCRQAAEVGWKLLCDGASALDAIEAAVRVMEDDPTYDAGRGSNLNAAGQVELDALIMDGATLGAGSVAAVQRVANPISLARLVMEKSEHVLLVADGAEQFAREHGVPICQPQDLLVGRELERWKALQADPTWRTPQAFKAASDTVGAVARDVHGNIAAATSTGGTSKKLPGRVGDSPLIGCGAYANTCTAGVSATGWGESLMKVVFSKLVCDKVEQGLTAQQAIEAGVRVLAQRVGGLGGGIIIDREGRIGFAYNTPRMARAYIVKGDIVSDV